MALPGSVDGRGPRSPVGTWALALFILMAASQAGQAQLVGPTASQRDWQIIQIMRASEAQFLRWRQNPLNEQQLQQYLIAVQQERRQWYQQLWKQAKNAKATSNSKKTTQAKGKGPLRVLFIGNSYTQVNQLPQMVAAMAQAGQGQAMQVDSQLVSGATLQQHWQQGVALRKIRQGKWDFVVLQDQSMTPIIAPQATLQYALLFNREIQKRGATTLYFLTWARRSLPGTQDLLTDAYLTSARLSRNAKVGPAGIAWQIALASDPKLVLHQDDGSHPNVAGTYLAACTFYAAIYDASPVGLPGRLSFQGQLLANLSEAEARGLQGYALQAEAQMAKQQGVLQNP
jgi:hypothetical protein